MTRTAFPKVIALIGALLTIAPAAHATLFNRGGGLLYDDVLNITWLQDANYARTSGYSSDGVMHTLSEAQNWANSLVYYDDIRHVSYDDWRLPSLTPLNGVSWNFSTYSYNGSTDAGWNNSAPNSELGYMFYINLGLTAMYSSTGTYQPDFGVIAGFLGHGGERDIGLVNNLQHAAYLFNDLANGAPMFFSTAVGSQVRAAQANADTILGSTMFAWAVREGDVASIAPPPPQNQVPEPSILALMILGTVASMLTHQKPNRT